MPFSQSYAFVTQMSSVWPTGTSVTDFSAVYKRGKVVWDGGWYKLGTSHKAAQGRCAASESPNQGMPQGVSFERQSASTAIVDASCVATYNPDGAANRAPRVVDKGGQSWHLC